MAIKWKKLNEEDMYRDWWWQWFRKQVIMMNWLNKIVWKPKKTNTKNNCKTRL